MASMLWIAPIVLLLATSSTCSAGRVVRTLQQLPTSTAPPPRPVDLKSAKDFTVLAYATITNLGPTTVGGYIGVAPGSAITGEGNISYSPLPARNGRASDPQAAQAKSDVTAAYLDASGRTRDVVNIPTGNIGGRTFTPGLYKTTSSFEVSSGTLTLSGKGVYIFQMESTFMIGTGLKMALIGGAQASDVFWTMGSSAVFEADSESVGTFMAYAAISVKSDATIEGRLFAMNEAVTLIRNEVKYPDAFQTVLP